ncbi:MAG: AMP-binding protein [Magnetococcales bacterium]|nr:AMP-binding protein [Magnetococcales bacterium]
MIQSFLERLAGGSPETLFWLHPSADGPVEAVAVERFGLEARRWAARIAARPEGVVAIFGRMTSSMLAAWFGAMLAGRLPTFISHPSRKITPEDYALKLENYRARFGGCLFVGESRDREVCAELLTPEDPEHAGDPRQLPPIALDPHRPLFLQCSSGTTGLQKAVAITPAMLEAQVAAHAHALGLDPATDRIVSWLPLYHDMGLAGVFLPALLTGTPLHLLDTFEWAANPGWLLTVIEGYGGTLCWLPNFAFSWLARVGGTYDLRTMRGFINCSEPVSTGAFARFKAAFGVDGGQLAVCYALAENVFAATLTPMGESPGLLYVDRMALARRQVTVLGEGRAGEHPETVPPEATALFDCGVPVPGVGVRIDCRSDEEGVGEILLSGPCAVSAYHGQPPPRDDGWFPSGDLGFMRDGRLYVTGRIKELIIHNGKNIHPADVEAAAEGSGPIHPGRVVAIGRQDPGLDSEQVLVLFEPSEDLTPERGRQIGATLRQRLDALFDIRSEVACVPRNWLKKTSSGKMARLENLRRFETALNTTVHLVGDSHARLFWSGPTTHHNRYRRIQGHWVGLLWSENWRQSLPFFAALVERLQPTDVLIVTCGEPECRSIFPVDPDPPARIARAVDQYRAFFGLLKRLWPGRLAYLTGIPTHPENIDNGDLTWPIRGTPEARYYWQGVFYAAMRALCGELVIHCLDLCTPLLGADGYLDPALLCDKAHLDPAHEGVVLKLLTDRFGHLDLAPNDPAPEEHVWDGTRAHFLALMRLKIVSIQPMIEAADWSRLVSGGLLDSLAIVALIAMLDRTFGFQIDPARLRREDFESLERIWERFGPGGQQALPSE